MTRIDVNKIFNINMTAHIHTYTRERKWCERDHRPHIFRSKMILWTVEKWLILKSEIILSRRKLKLTENFPLENARILGIIPISSYSPYNFYGIGSLNYNNPAQQIKAARY